MAIIGYIHDSQNIQGADKYLEKMHSLGCHKIYEEGKNETCHRMKWRYILENLSKGDTIIIYKLSNALGRLVELPMFMNLCSKNRIRLISLGDGIDTDGILFDMKVNDFIPVLTTFGTETYGKQQHFTKNNISEFTGVIRREQKRHERLLKEKRVLNEYNSGVAVDSICKNLGVGLGSVYRILRRHDLKPDRQTGKVHGTKEPKESKINNFKHAAII